MLRAAAVGLLLLAVLLAGCGSKPEATSEHLRFCAFSRSTEGFDGADVLLSPSLDGDSERHGVTAAGATNHLDLTVEWSTQQGSAYVVLLMPNGEERFDASPAKFSLDPVPAGDYAFVVRSDGGALLLDYTYRLAVPGETPDGVDGCDASGDSATD